MRRRLVLVALATSSMVALAFLIPLFVFVRNTTERLAVFDGQQAAQTIVNNLNVTNGDAQSALESYDGSKGDATIFLSDGRTFPAGSVADRLVQLAQLAERPTSTMNDVKGGREIVYPSVRSSGDTRTVDVVRLFVPNRLLYRGVKQISIILGALAVALIGVGVAVADRLATSIVRPVRRLAEVTRQLSAGQADARTEPSGPPEVEDVGRAVNTLADRIDDLLAAEREMIADLSHRLRTPLTALRLNAETLADTDFGERVLTDIEEMERAVSNVITEARAPRRPTTLVCDMVDVSLHRAEFWAVLAEDQHRPWTVDLAPGPAYISLRRNDLEAALDAMLGNVFEYSPEGAAVRLSVVVDADQVTLAVEDDGPGFPEGFVVERGSSGGTSTGLGLDIVKRSAEAAGGRMQTVNHAGGGARVAMTFPIRPATDGNKRAVSNV